MTKEDTIRFINSRYYRNIDELKRHMHLPLSEYPVELIKLGPDIDIEIYECECDDGYIKIKGANTTRVWHEDTIGYIMAY